MSKQVYLLKGEGLPPKLAVVAFDLEPEYLLEIENRFVPRGRVRYSSLAPVHLGIVKLAERIHAPGDQSYFPGYEQYTLESEGGTSQVPTDGEPGPVLLSEEFVTTGRRAFLVTYTKDDVVENWVLVREDAEGMTAKALATTLAQLPGKVRIECKLISVGTFQVDQAITRNGFPVKLGPTLTPVAA